MCPPYVGNHSNRRLYDGLQCLHLSHFRDTGLKDTQFRMLIQQPYRQRHSNLRIVTPRRTGNGAFRTQQLIQPLLYDCLSVTSRNAHYRNLKMLAVLGCQPLQGPAGIAYLQEVGIGIITGLLRQFRYHKITNPTDVKFRDIFMPVIALGF